MTDFTSLRETMVASQIRPNRVTNTRLLAALLTTPREAYLPADLQPLAYVGQDIPLSSAFQEAGGRFVLSPMVFAWLVQAAAVKAADRVLDLGAATGYSAAVLAGLAARVTAVEENGVLAAFAQKVLAKQGITNVNFVTGPLTAGAPQDAPFDVIIVNGSITRIPDELAGQLAEGGRLAAVTGKGAGSKLRLYEKTGGVLRNRIVEDAGAPCLPGFEEKPVFVF
jgi:protein-L-isoaspartate(D-aspartate) O-methyltransferase